MGRMGLTVPKRRVAEKWENNVTSSGLWGLPEGFGEADLGAAVQNSAGNNS